MNKIMKKVYLLFIESRLNFRKSSKNKRDKGNYNVRGKNSKYKYKNSYSVKHSNKNKNKSANNRNLNNKTEKNIYNLFPESHYINPDIVRINMIKRE